MYRPDFLIPNSWSNLAQKIETTLVRNKFPQCIFKIIFSVEKSDSSKQTSRIGWNKWIL